MTKMTVNFERKAKSYLFIILIVLCNCWLYNIAKPAYLFFSLVTSVILSQPQKSIPYCLQIHSTALGGKIFVVAFTPKLARASRLLESHRRKVLLLTPAASASSYLYTLFIAFIFLQSYEKILTFARETLFLRKKNGRKRTEADNTLSNCRTFAVWFETQPVMMPNVTRYKWPRNTLWLPS